MPSTDAVASETAPRLDGVVLGDPALADVVPATGFRQTQPDEGEPASERTEVRVIFTESTLYVGVICYDRDPGSITVSGSRRDSSLDDSDSIQIIHTICSDSRWPVSWLASGSGRGAAQPQDHPVCCRRPRSQRRASGDDDRVDVGVDLKYAVTPSLTLDLTCTTDFVQVEVDRIE